MSHNKEAGLSQKLKIYTRFWINVFTAIASLENVQQVMHEQPNNYIVLQQWQSGKYKSLKTKCKSQINLFIVLCADWMATCLCQELHSMILVLHTHVSLSNHHQVHAVEVWISCTSQDPSPFPLFHKFTVVWQLVADQNKVPVHSSSSRSNTHKLACF